MSRERLRKILESELQRPANLLRPQAHADVAPGGGLRVPLRPSPELGGEARPPVLDKGEDTAFEARADSRADLAPFGQGFNAEAQLYPLGRNDSPELRPAPGTTPLTGIQFALNGAAPNPALNQGFLLEPLAFEQAARPQSAAPVLEGVDPRKLSVGQWMSVLNQTLESHNPPRERYKAVTDAYAQAPDPVKLELRSRFLGGQNPNSTQTQRLLEAFGGFEAQHRQQQSREALRDQRFSLPQQNLSESPAFNPHLGNREGFESQNAAEQAAPPKPQLSVETVKQPPQPKARPPRKTPTKAHSPARKHTAQMLEKLSKTPNLRRRQPKRAALKTPELPRSAALKPTALKLPTLKAPAAFKAKLAGPETASFAAGKAKDPKEQARLEALRAKSNAEANAFLKTLRAKAQRLEAHAASLAPKIRAAATAAKTRVTGASRQQKALLESRISAAMANARTKTAAQITSLNNQAKAAKAALKPITTTSKNQVTTLTTTTDDALRAKHLEQRGPIEAKYQASRADYETAGHTAGDKAPPIADQHAAEWEAKPTPEDQDHWWYMGVREKEQNEARANADRQTGAGYQSGYPEEALKAHTESLAGVDQDLTGFAQTVRDPSLDGTKKAKEAALKKLDDSEKTQGDAIEAARAEFERAANAQLQRTLGQLGQKKTSLSHLIDQLTQQTTHGIDAQSNAAITNLNATMHAAAQGLEQTINAFATQLRTQQTPDPAKLKRFLKTIETQIDKSVAASLKQGTTQSATAQTGLSNQANKATQQIGTTAQQGVQAAQSLEAALVRSVAQLLSTATSKISAAQTTHTTASKNAEQQAKTALDAILKGNDPAYTAALDGLAANLKKAAENYGKALEADLDKGFLGAMKANEDKAAAQVPSGWKKLVKILLIIAVIVVIAVIAGPAVIGAIGAFAATLGAGAALAGAVGAIVGGAIIGAVSGGLIQMGNNAIDNIGVDAKYQKGLFDGVGQAMISGAISGAIGGGLGFAAQGAMQGMSFAGKMALDTGIGAFSGQATEFITTGHFQNPIEMLKDPSMWIGMAVSAASHAGGPRVNANGETIRPATKLEAVQEHFQAKGAAFGEKVAFQVADVTGVRSANVRTSTSPQLEPNEAKISGYNDKKTRVEVGEGVHPNDQKVHVEEAKNVRADNSNLQQLKDRLFGNGPEFEPGTKAYELNAEAVKHQKMADWRFAEAERLKASGNTAEANRLIQEAHDLQAASHEFLEQSRYPNNRFEPGDGEIAGSKRTYKNHDEIKDLLGKPFDRTALPDGYTTFELEGGRKVAARVTPDGKLDLTQGVLLVNEKGNVSVSPQNRLSYDYIKIYENNPNARPGISFGRDGYTVHHMIADKVASQHTLTVKAMELCGFNIDQFQNYAAMPMKNQFFKLDGAEVGHWSSHPEFDAIVVQSLTDIQTDLQAKYGDISTWSTHPEKVQISADLKQRISILQNEIFERIKNGQVPMTDEGTSTGLGRIH